MREIGAFEAKNEARGSPLDRGGARRGNRHHAPRQAGRPPRPSAARLRTEKGPAGLSKGIIERSKGVTLGGLKIKDLINEGRRW